MPDLLSEATSLSDMLYGTAPTPAAVAPSADLEMIAPTFDPLPPGPPPPTDEPDPDASQPFNFVPATVHAALPPAAAARLGPDGAAHMAEALGALPRDLVSLLDQEGALSGELSPDLWAEVGRSMRAGDPDAGLAAAEVDLDAVLRHAQINGLDDDPHVVANVACLLSALPLKVRAAITHKMAASPDLWALAADLGDKAWGFELRRPINPKERK